jgi:hypothetical protein
VTLLVTPADAERLTLATRQEPVRLALRNFRDEEYVGTSGISTRALFGYAPPPPAPVAPVVAKAKPRKAPPAPYVVDVLLGTKVMRQEFGPGGAERVRPESPALGAADNMTESRRDLSALGG